MSERAARARALELLVAVGIPAAETRIDHYPHQFSGGMRQRVVIALALCAGPKLIIADEPTTALDVSIQAQITGLLKRLCREHRTAVMLVTHDMGVIAETADRVAVMYAGRVVEIGPVDDVIAPAAPSLLGGPDGLDPERARRVPRCSARSTARCRGSTRCRRAARSIRAVRSAWRAARPSDPRSAPDGVSRAACFLAQEALSMPDASDIILQVDDAACWFDVSPPWLSRVIERRPRRVLKAVDGVSFAVRRGTTFSIVGESGCGKSTLARMVVGLHPADARNAGVRRYRGPGRRAFAAARPDDLPGPLCEPQSALARRRTSSPSRSAN